MENRSVKRTSLLPLADMAARLHTASRRRSFPIIAAIFFCVSVAWIYNANSRVIDQRHLDEMHTLVWGTLAAGGEAQTVRVGEVNRLFVKLLYPAAIYYMNSYMGGEHYVTGWTYPGGYYLRDRLNRGEDAPGANESIGASRDPELPSIGFHTVDPNIQDYVFFQRTAFGGLAVLSFLLLLWRLHAGYGFAAAAAWAGLVLFGDIVFRQFLIFYSETTLFVIFNLVFAFLISTKNVNLPTAILLGFAAAAAVSTKLTGICVAGPAFAHVAIGALRGGGGGRTLIVGAFLASSLVGLVAINAHVATPFSFINETMANVYHHKTGHRVTVDGVHLASIMKLLGYGTVFLFFVSSAYLAFRPQRRHVCIYALILLVASTVVTMSGSAMKFYYFERNFAFVFVAMSFVVALAVGRLVGSDRRAGIRDLVGAICLSVFIVGAADRALAIRPLSTSFFERNAERIADCGSVAVVGIREDEYRRFVGADEAVFFDTPRGPFNLSENPSHFDKYLAFDCVVALRRGQTKQITNFFAPQAHSLASRVGDRFFFERAASYRPDNPPSGASAAQ